MVCKSNIHSPQIGIKCNQFYSRMDSHIAYTHQLKRCRRCTNQFSLDYLQEIRKTQLVQNRPVPSQQLENTHVKKKRRKLEATSTITSNELSNTVTHIVTMFRRSSIHFEICQTFPVEINSSEIRMRWIFANCNTFRISFVVLIIQGCGYVMTVLNHILYFQGFEYMPEMLLW